MASDPESIPAPDFGLLADRLHQLGWATRVKGDALTARKVAITAQWLLGKRQVEQRLHLELDRATRALSLAETATEVTLGIPPLTFSTTRAQQQGRAVTELRTDTGAGADGGTLHYGNARELVGQECARVGWTLKLRQSIV